MSFASDSASAVTTRRIIAIEALNLCIESFEKFVARRNVTACGRGARLVHKGLGPSQIVVAHRLEIGDRHHERFVNRAEPAGCNLRFKPFKLVGGQGDIHHKPI
jgi:hypothetical protein